jgi:hypothetical protein
MKIPRITSITLLVVCQASMAGVAWAYSDVDIGKVAKESAFQSAPHPGKTLLAETDPISCSSDPTDCDGYKPNDSLSVACGRQYRACLGVTDKKTCDKALQMCLAAPKS